MAKVRAKVDVYVGGSYRYKGQVFVYNGPDDANLEPVSEDVPLGLPTEPKRDLQGASIAGTPTPQIVFDFDDPVDQTTVKPTHLDLFA